MEPIKNDYVWQERRHKRHENGILLRHEDDVILLLMMTPKEAALLDRVSPVCRAVRAGTLPADELEEAQIDFFMESLARHVDWPGTAGEKRELFHHGLNRIEVRHG